MSEKLPKGIFSIGGNLYGVRCLKVGTKENASNEWDDFLNAVGEDEELIHSGLIFWGQDTMDCMRTHRSLRGGLGLGPRAWFGFHAAKRAVYYAFRPVLVPLGGGALAGKSDGDIVQLGNLYLDDVAHPMPQRLFCGGDVPEYKQGKKISFGDAPGKAPLQWIVWNGILVCDRPVLTNVSWNDLNEQGLVLGKQFQQNKPGSAVRKIGAGSRSTTFRLENGEVIAAYWEPQHTAAEEDLRLAFRVPCTGAEDKLPIFEYIGPDSDILQISPLWTPSVTPVEVAFAHSMDELETQVKAFQENYLYAGDKILSASGVPCYRLDPTKSTSLAVFPDYFVEGVALNAQFRADEQEYALRALSAIHGLKYDEVCELYDNMGDWTIEVLEAAAMRMPSMPNRAAETVMEIAEKYLLKLFASSDSKLTDAEDIFGFEEMVTLLALNIYWNPILEKRAYFATEEQIQAIALKVICSMASKTHMECPYFIAP